MELLKKTAKREEIVSRAAASAASLGMWRYASVLPDVTPVTLGEGEVCVCFVVCLSHVRSFSFSCRYVEDTCCGEG